MARTLVFRSRGLATSAAALLATGCFYGSEPKGPPVPRDTGHRDTDTDTDADADTDTDADADVASCGELEAWLDGVEGGLDLIERGDSGALAIEELLLRIRARALQASSEVTGDDTRALLAIEVDTLVQAIDQLADSTRHGDLVLTDGSTASVDIAVGDGEVVGVALADLNTTILGVDPDTMSVEEAFDAQGSLDLQAAARARVDAWRSSLAADQAVLLAWGRSLEQRYEACEDPCEDCCASRFEGREAAIGAEPEAAERAVVEAIAANVQDALGLVDAAGGGAESITSVIEQMRALGVESASETLDDDVRAGLQARFLALVDEIVRITCWTSYNDHILLEGLVPALDVQVGDANTTLDRIAIELADLTVSTLGVDSAAVDLSTITGAQAAIDVFDTALDSIAATRAGLLGDEAVLEVILADLERQLDAP